ncbi:hypothetical protein RJ640_025073 [Escallonia rubra]|uniref:CCHC-type domain-containing protein n=1 Tax=Escallonia rubra TaxID=112253 RepID=A0AA88UTH2_9ASTE|nr:hypothetical protein RJ640_025073 [Escallonia rubra]
MSMVLLQLNLVFSATLAPCEAMKSSSSSLHMVVNLVLDTWCQLAQSLGALPSFPSLVKWGLVRGAVHLAGGNGPAYGLRSGLPATVFSEEEIDELNISSTSNLGSRDSLNISSMMQRLVEFVCALLSHGLITKAESSQNAFTAVLMHVQLSVLLLLPEDPSLESVRGSVHVFVSSVLVSSEDSLEEITGLGLGLWYVNGAAWLCEVAGGSAGFQVCGVRLVMLNLAPKVKYQVLTETSPTTLWQKLENIYMSKSLSNRLYLKKDLYQLRMDEGSDLGNHISEFNRLVSQLSSIDVKLEEEDHAILLLSSLPKSYETLKTMLLIGNETLLIGKETLLVYDVMSVLMDSSRVNGTSSSSQSEGLVVRYENKNGHGRGRDRSRNRNPGHEKDRSKSRGKQDKSSIKCWYCKEIGHIARRCLERKEKKNGKKHVNNANVAEEDDKSSDGDLYLVSSVEQQ